ncbi:hypothetical protein B0H14DRAFT_2649351 [Mycena olivaceomarginata]|nr:hypothetical protein B0H14DRAFT_2649351 [Mycena olivaceomarginata]
MFADLGMQGYKLRKHIAKALQCCCRGTRSWATLSSQSSISCGKGGRTSAQSPGPFLLGVRLWINTSRSAARTKRLCGSTSRSPPSYLHADEEDFLVHHEVRLQHEGRGGLALQVAWYRMERARFNGIHLDRLAKLSKEDGFTASISRGISLSRERCVPPRNASDMGDAPEERARSSAPSAGNDDDDEEGEGTGMWKLLRRLREHRGRDKGGGSQRDLDGADGARIADGNTSSSAITSKITAPKSLIISA